MWWYINAGASASAAGSRYYRDYKLVLNYQSYGPITNNVRVFAGETTVSVFDFTGTPATPLPEQPQDETVLPSLTPQFSWSAFNSSAPGRTQAGFQLRVRCDTDGDVIVDDTGFITNTSGRTHIYTPGAYMDVDLVTGDQRVSQALQYGKHYHWHVRFMNGVNRIGGVALTHLPETGPAWRAAAVHDFNGDGHPDIVWQHATGPLGVWFMEQTNRIGGMLLAHLPQPGPDWRLNMVYDIDRDGEVDFVWRHSSGLLSVWHMNGLYRRDGRLIDPSYVDPSWQLADIFDFNEDGHGDFLWQNINNGALSLWHMNGADRVSGTPLNHLPQTGPAWRVIRVGE